MKRIFVYITFHRDVKPIDFRAVMGVDINFNNVTYTVIDLNGNLVYNRCYTFQRIGEGSSPKEAC